MFKVLSKNEAYKIIDDTEKIFTRFNMDSRECPTNLEEANKLKEKITKLEHELLIIR